MAKKRDVQRLAYAFRLTNDVRLINALKGFSIATQKSTWIQSLKKSIRPIQRALKRASPKKTGKLRKSIIISENYFAINKTTRFKVRGGKNVSDRVFLGLTNFGWYGFLQDRGYTSRSGSSVSGDSWFSGTLERKKWNFNELFQKEVTKRLNNQLKKLEIKLEKNKIR